jgi:hypothetical protein
MKGADTLLPLAAAVALLGGVLLGAPVDPEGTVSTRGLVVPQIEFSTAVDQHESVAVLLATNPFRRTRRPATETADGSEPLLDELPLPPLRLIGVTGPPWAIVVAGFLDSPHAIVLQVEDEHEGFRVAEIAADSVLLRSPDGRVVLLRLGGY